MASSNVGPFQNNTCEDKDSFQNWLSGQLKNYNADDEVFLPYIMSILEETECSSKSQSDDVLESLSDILEGLGLDEDCNNQENLIHLKKEIWRKWNEARSSGSTAGVEINGHGAACGTTEKDDIQTQLAKITESRAEAYKASAKASAKRHSQDEEERKAVKAAILAQYQNVEEESEESNENIEKEDELSVPVIGNFRQLGHYANELESRRPFVLPQALGGGHITYVKEPESDEEIENEDEERKKKLQFVRNPEEIRQEAERKRQESRNWKDKSKGGGIPNRDVVGRAKGQGQDKKVLINRKHKTENKGKRTRAAADHKMSKGMF